MAWADPQGEPGIKNLVLPGRMVKDTNGTKTFVNPTYGVDRYPKILMGIRSLTNNPSPYNG